MIKDKNLNVPDEFKNIYKVLNKLEQRIATLEKVIGKLQLRLGDVVLYIDKKEEQSWVNFAKVRRVICMTQQTGNVDQKETK